MGLTTTFVGVDQDAMGDGGDDATLPIDTWLQRRLQYNVEACLSGYKATAWSPVIGSSGTLTSYVGIRPYASSEWHSVWYGVLPVYRDQTAIAVTLVYHSDTVGHSGSQAGAVDVRITLGDGSDSGETELATTYSAGVVTGHQTITVSLNERQQKDGEMKVVIWARSRSTSFRASTVGSSSDGTTNLIYHEYPFILYDSAVVATPGFFDPNSTGPGPLRDSNETTYIYGSHPGGGGANKFDLLYTGARTSGGTIGVTLKPVVPAQSSTVVTGQASYQHHCLFVRSVYFEPVIGEPNASYTSKASYPASAMVDLVRYAPNVPFGSAEAMNLAALVRRAYFQKYLTLTGPRGVATSDTTGDLRQFSANGYAAHWPFVMGDTVAGPLATLIDDSIFCRTENPTFILTCKWLSVEHGSKWNQSTSANKDKGAGGEGNFELIPGLAKWTITAVIEQLTDAASGDGDWATDITEFGSINAANNKIDVPVYGASVLFAGPDDPPVLRGMDADYQFSKGATSAAGFWFKEGSLFNQGGDTGLLYETTHTISTADMVQADTLKPFRLKMTALLDSYTDPLVELETSPEARLRLTLVSFTLTEHPEAP